MCGRCTAAAGAQYAAGGGVGGVRLLALAACILALLASAAEPAQACSFSWAPGYSPSDIRHRADVTLVRGAFVFVDAKTGKVITEGEFNLTDDSQALGRISRVGKRPILTKSWYSELSIECGAYLGPSNNVSGKFWIERKRDKVGRQRLLMWRPE
jgi:hypothetical protein